MAKPRKGKQGETKLANKGLPELSQAIEPSGAVESSEANLGPKAKRAKTATATEETGGVNMASTREPSTSSSSGGIQTTKAS